MLSIVTLVYNALEGIIAVVAGVLAGSISLVGFGIDSVIEVASGGASLWRLNAEAIVMAPLIAKEGVEALRGEEPCDNCSVSLA